MMVYCGFCDRSLDQAGMETHTQKERVCECVICKHMEPGEYCRACGWCKGAPTKNLGKEDWEKYIAVGPASEAQAVRG